MKKHRLRHLGFATLALATLLNLSACSPQGYFELDNRSGQDVVVDGPNGPQPAPAGRVTGRIALGASTLRTSNCTYTYAGFAISGATPREEIPFLGAPSYSYHVRLEPDFGLRLFSITRDGQLGDEIAQGDWPARPQVDCHAKG